MKIGFSFGRCVRDIVNGEVSLEDVLVIISGTHMETPEQMKGVVRTYLSYPEYLDGCDADRCQEVARQLWYAGKLHQPRRYGASATHIPEAYVWMDVVPTAKDADPAVREAWQGYRMLLAMRGNTIPDK